MAQLNLILEMLNLNFETLVIVFLLRILNNGPVIFNFGNVEFGL
jgi:hypothetical protein